MRRSAGDRNIKSGYENEILEQNRIPFPNYKIWSVKFQNQIPNMKVFVLRQKTCKKRRRRESNIQRVDTQRSTNQLEENRQHAPYKENIASMLWRLYEMEGKPKGPSFRIKRQRPSPLTAAFLDERPLCAWGSGNEKNGNFEKLFVESKWPVLDAVSIERLSEIAKTALRHRVYVERKQNG